MKEQPSVQSIHHPVEDINLAWDAAVAQKRHMDTMFSDDFNAEVDAG